MAENFVKIVQYMRPTGQPRERTAEVRDHTYKTYKELQTHGLRLESEVLVNGDVSITLTHEVLGDAAIIIVPNDAQLVSKMSKMIDDFDLAAFEARKREYYEEEE